FEIPMLAEVERRQLLTAWNQTRVEYGAGKCAHELFEEIVARAPEAIAVFYGEQELSYAELNRRANQLANHLRKLGVGPGRQAALCVERSLEMVIGILAVLKAGGAYVPLEPSYPAARLNHILESSQASVVISQYELIHKLGEMAPKIVWIDEWKQIEHEREQNLGLALCPQELAYVIYTSGSTGRPKGVAIEHKQLVNYVNGI